MQESNRIKTTGGVKAHHILAFVIFSAAIFGGILNSCWFAADEDKQIEEVEGGKK